MTQPTDEITALARRWAVEIDMNVPGAPDWQRLLGVEEFKPTFEQRREADEGYDDEGSMRQAITGSSERLEIKLKRRQSASGAYNAVHEYLRLKARAANAITGEVHVRWFDRLPGGVEAYDGRAIVEWNPDGGNGGAKDMISLVLHIQGPAVEITNPNASPLPAVTALAPASGPTAGGNHVTIKGRQFTGATGVSFAANPAPVFTVVDDTRIVAEAPAGSAGVAQVTVTTPDGTSATADTGNDYTYV